MGVLSGDALHLGYWLKLLLSLRKIIDFGLFALLRCGNQSVFYCKTLRVLQRSILFRFTTVGFQEIWGCKNREVLRNRDVCTMQNLADFG